MPPRPSEQALIGSLAAVAKVVGSSSEAFRFFCTSLGRGQLAGALAATWPTATVACNFQDLHAARLAAVALSERPSVVVTCEPDPPLDDQSCRLVALPLTAHGDAEWTLELLDQSQRLLSPGGILLASTDNPDDRWLRAQLQRRFDRVSAERAPEAAVYRAVRRHQLEKAKNHVCWFAFRDGTRLLKIVSRPGVFSHRRLDTGARALIEAMRIEPDQRVVEFGCGSGAVSLAAAARAPGVHVLALDANPRAVQCVRWGAEANGLADSAPNASDELAARPSILQVVLNDEAQCDRPGTYDVALANPPYYSKHRIARLFAAGAARALRSGGSAYFVTKDAEWYVENLPEWFDSIELLEIRGYVVVQCRRRS